MFSVEKRNIDTFLVTGIKINLGKIYPNKKSAVIAREKV